MTIDRLDRGVAMIKLLLFDLGETLLHGTQPFPHVVSALDAITQFRTASGDTIGVGLISDFTMPELPVTESKIVALEQEYQAILAPTGLEHYFQPFVSHVTLSSRAGVLKPDQAIFKLAVQRSGTGATLNECLFITENNGHLIAAKQYGMAVVRFGSGPGLQPSFTDWSNAPALVANLVTPQHSVNLQLATAMTLSVHHDLVGFEPKSTSDGQQMRGRAAKLVQHSDPKLKQLDGVYVELPTEVTVNLGAGGQVMKVTSTPPEADATSDAVNYVSSLLKSQRVAVPGQPAVNATHELEHDATGRKRLVRRRFSAY